MPRESGEVEVVRKRPRLMETSAHLVIVRLVHYRTHLMKRIAFPAARPWLLKMYPVTEAPKPKNGSNAKVLAHSTPVRKYFTY
jgi:hypothetical protein